MIRRIIEIDEDKCNGCGACAAACHEGAIGMVDGKAKLLRDDYCEVVDRLERHGLIERRRDNSDHRVFRLYLTEKGREQNERNHSSWLGFVGDLMSPLSDDEKAEYLNILKKLDKQALFLEERMEEDAKKEGENHA